MMVSLTTVVAVAVVAARWLLMQHGLPLPNAGNGNVLEYNLVIEDY
jgi:hypothetical protein